jgi:tetratricopeptide (TPR) repeat protein
MRDAAVLWGLLLASVTVSLAQSETSESLRQTGLLYYREGHIANALDAYQRAIQEDPLYEHLYLERADILLADGRPGDAEAMLLEASRLFPDSRSPAYNLLYHDLAEMWVASGRLGKARDAMDMASRVPGPISPAVVHKRIGDFNTDLLLLDEALAAYLLALEHAPDSFGTRLALANLHLRRNSLDDALAEFNALVGTDPGSVDANNGIAEVHRRRGDFKEAAEAAGRTLELSPDHPGALYIRGAALVRLGRSAEGREALDRYLRLMSDTQAEEHRQRDINAYRKGGMDLQVRGELQAAIELYGEGLRSYPDSPALYLALGAAQSEAGAHRDAIGTFLAWLESGAADPALAHRSLAREYALIGDMEASERHRELSDARLAAAPSR